MGTRIVAIGFPQLVTDWMLRRRPELGAVPFGMALTERGRRVLKAVNRPAQEKGVHAGMVVADCRALVPELKVMEFDPERPGKILNALAEWCMRYTPLVAVNMPDGLLLDASGCTHLWGGEEKYLHDIEARLNGFGYSIRIAMADTIGAAWAVCRFGKTGTIVLSGTQAEALRDLPAPALRLEEPVCKRLEKLGLKTIGSFMQLPRTALRRRFGTGLLSRMDQALGGEMELMDSIKPVPPYRESLPCLEPIRTAAGIEAALKMLLEILSQRMARESKGLRKCRLHCHRLDGLTRTIEIGTSRPVRNAAQLFRLFELKTGQLDPGLGIELFVLEAPVVEDLPGTQDTFWASSSADEAALAALLDRLAGKIGPRSVHRYLPAEHYWPERSVKEAVSLTETPATAWRTDLPRPLHLLPRPEPIEVSVPIPDYPPMLFRYRGVLHSVKKADGPERIGQEWWTQAERYRDYYCVEDQQGARYWLFRAGDYQAGDAQWFIHGFFA